MAASARVLPFTLSKFLIFLLFSNLVIILVSGEETNEDFVRTLDRKLIGLKKEKLSHFRFYWHDVLSGENPTSVSVVKSQSRFSTTTGFGLIRMIDDSLTLGPKLSSKLVGRAQGFYALASQGEVGLLMAMNFAFIEGKYNGSTITILGRNTVFSKVREMPVIGGSGLFRFARGYVHASTYMFNQTSGDAIVEYNVYVMHY